MHRRIGMYTRRGTFDEAVALVSGYDSGRGFDFLLGFGRWLAARNPDTYYHNWTFFALVELEAAAGVGRTTEGLLPGVADARCVDQLFGLLDLYLAGVADGLAVDG